MPAVEDLVFEYGNVFVFLKLLFLL